MEQNFNNRELYLARTAKKMSRREVADIINVNQQTISDYESGKSQPKLGRIKELASAVGISPESLLKFSNEKNDNKKDVLLYCNYILQKIQYDILKIEELNHRDVLLIIQNYYHKL